jgi:hypothetical protein
MRSYLCVCIRYSVALVCLSLSSVYAAEVVISDDGRQIRLNDDGTWVQISQDRFATTIAGERVRLRPDGSWNYVNGRSPRLSNADAPEPLIEDEVVLFLKSVEILRREIKRAKSTHAETRMRFTIQIDNVTQEHVSVDKSARFSASSNRGGDYETLEVSGTDRVDAGASGEVVVIVDGSPVWFGTKYLSLEVPANAIGNPVRRMLNKRMDEVRRITVDNF